MHNKKWLTAMAVGLGVLAGSAQATQMKMNIVGKLTHTGNSDSGQQSFWGYATSNQLPGDLDIQITIQFNSDILATKPAGTTSYQGTGPDFSAELFLNNAKQNITSNTSWRLTEGRDLKSIGLDFLEANIKGNDGRTAASNNLYGTLTFAEDSLPILNKMRLGQAQVATIDSSKSQLNFSYSTGNPSHWTTQTTLKIVPTSATIAPVPEPETWAMMVAGLGLVGFATRRRSC